MRKLLASALSFSVLAGPVTLAFAADDNDNLNQRAAAVGSQAVTDPLERAQAKVERATERVKARHEQIRERRLERREAAQEAVEQAAAPTATGSAAGSAASPQLEGIAACESGGDPSAVSSDGTYRGKYQFSTETWASVGGSGDPAAAPEAEQDMRAQMLLEQSGSSPWPNCG